MHPAGLGQLMLFLPQTAEYLPDPPVLLHHATLWKGSCFVFHFCSTNNTQHLCNPAVWL